MKLFQILLVAGLAASCCLLPGGEAATDNSFDKINDYLTKAVKSDSVSTNMKAADDLFFIEDRKRGISLRKNKMKSALSKFIMMKNLQSSNYCNRAAYLVFSENNELTGRRARSQEPERRIDKLVRQFTIDHANICMPIYAKRLTEQYSASDVRLSYVRKFTDYLVGMQRVVERTRRSHMSDEEMMRAAEGKIAWREPSMSDLLATIEKGPAVESKQQLTLQALEATTGESLWRLPNKLYPSAAYTALRSMAQIEYNPHIKYTEPTTRKSTDMPILESLYRNYVLLPCEYYVETIGATIVEPAAYFYSFTKKIDESNPDEFYTAMLRYKICKILTTTKDRVRLMDEVARLTHTTQDKIQEKRDELKKMMGVVELFANQ